MTIQAQLADGRILEFPDGTDPAVIQTTVKRLVSEDVSGLTGELGEIPNPFGGVSTEKSITITDPRLNEGLPTNIPQLIQGQSQEAVQRILADQSSQEDQERAILRAVERQNQGQNIPSFNTIELAVNAAKQRSDAGGSLGQLQADEPQDTASLAEDVQAGFSQLPGVPALAEFAAGFNRSVVDFIDFLGPDTVNAVLSLSGSEKRVPTLRETIPGIEGGFVEEGLGREVLATAGEVAPLALGVGQALRSLASKLPAFTAGESTATGVIRQFGATTPQQDIALGAVAGAGEAVGGELGEAIGGEPGRRAGELVGGVAAPIATVPLAAARNTAKKLLSEAVPSIDQLKATARGIYKSLDDSGVRVEAESFDTLADDIARTLNREGADRDLTPAANAVIRRFTEEKGLPKTLTELDTLRKVAKGAAGSIDRNEARLGSLAVNKLDDFLDKFDGGKEFKAARDLWGRARKTEVLEMAIDDARLQASGIENGIRTQFRAIAKKINRGKLPGFTKQEREAIEGVASGTRVRNVARFLGKFGVMDGVTSRTLSTLAGAGTVAAATGSPAAGLAVPLIGQVSGALAERLTRNSARMAMDIIRAGKNGSKIAEIYTRNTPKGSRNSAELAELLLKNEVPLERINLQTANPLMANAAIIAAVALSNDREQP